MVAAPRTLTVGALLGALLVAGCGSGSSAHSRSGGTRQTSRRGSSTTPTISLPTPAPTGVKADAAAVRVIKAWSNLLRQGDVQGAAAYFALPSQMINGIGAGGIVSVIDIHTLSDAEQANASLPCGARFISADKRGRYVNAIFRLTGRPGPGGSDCNSGDGATARTNFVIKGGRIVDWIRAPDDPGDNGGSRSAPQPPTPVTPSLPIVVA